MSEEQGIREVSISDVETGLGRAIPEGGNTVLKKHLQVNYQCCCRKLQAARNWNVGGITEDPGCLTEQQEDANSKEHSCRQSRFNPFFPTAPSEPSLRHCYIHSPLKRFYPRDKTDLPVYKQGIFYPESNKELLTKWYSKHRNDKSLSQNRRKRAEAGKPVLDS